MDKISKNQFLRTVSLSDLRASAFIFGPRMTGKTSLLRNLECKLYLDLLDPEQELLYKQDSALLWRNLQTLPDGAQVIIDEIQRVPKLLDYVQMGIDQKNLFFMLSGSSARKLKRGGANLLGGRALDLRLHPLTHQEIGEEFQLEVALQFGTLPKIYSTVLQSDPATAKNLLRSYLTTYIKEEIQAEALTRNVGAFQRFLSISAQANACVIEFANIARESGVPASTVKEYYSILEDTLLGEMLWPWDRSERKKARPKFYFFDCGVVRAIQQQLNDPPNSAERGFLFETWFIRELIRLRDYGQRDHSFSFWRKEPYEVDVVVQRGQKVLMAFECKTGKDNITKNCVESFRSTFGEVPLYVVTPNAFHAQRLPSGVDVVPWREAFELYTGLGS